MSQPIASIILPVYNSEEYVGEAIKSVLDQLYPRFELLIINDGSTDHSLEVLKSFSDNRIKIFNQTNQGVSAARNVGLNHMRGDFFCFLDADDRLTPQSIEARLKWFIEDPRVSFVDGKIEIWDKDFREIQEVREQNYSGSPFRGLLEIDSSCFFGPTWMIRRDANRRYQFEPSLTHGEDLYFYISIADQGDYKAVDEVIYQYRKGHASAMSNIPALGKGYQRICKLLEEDPNITKDQTEVFRRKFSLIMFKSYLAHGYIIKALRLLL